MRGTLCALPHRGITQSHLYSMDNLKLATGVSVQFRMATPDEIALEFAKKFTSISRTGSRKQGRSVGEWHESQVGAGIF
jgi:hypothetical protein